MLYVISCTDKPDHGQVRQENRPAHLDYPQGHSASVPITPSAPCRSVEPIGTTTPFERSR